MGHAATTASDAAQRELREQIKRELRAEMKAEMAQEIHRQVQAELAASMAGVSPEPAFDKLGIHICNGRSGWHDRQNQKPRRPCAVCH